MLSLSFIVRMLPKLALSLALVFSALQAAAHEVRPALLNIQETQPGVYKVLWKIPVLDGNIARISPVFPPAGTIIAEPSVETIPGAQIEKSSYKAADGSLVGGTIMIGGLEAYQIDTLIQMSLLDGTLHSVIVRPGQPYWTVPAVQSGWDVFTSYTLLGIEHIFGGLDHLLFVLALILLIRSRMQILKAVTAFTLGHSVTLALAALGFVNVPARPTEAVIAMSIVFLAGEIIRSHRGQTSLAITSPWIISAGFGLIHGLGFAGALTEIGLPQNSILLALVAFNVGVEIGQIMFIVLVITFMALGRLVWRAASEFGLRYAPYAIGTIAGFWTVERLIGLA